MQIVEKGELTEIVQKTCNGEGIGESKDVGHCNM